MKKLDRDTPEWDQESPGFLGSASGTWETGQPGALSLTRSLRQGWE
jgi:hypothetical protein